MALPIPLAAPAHDTVLAAMCSLLQHTAAVLAQRNRLVAVSSDSERTLRGYIDGAADPSRSTDTRYRPRCYVQLAPAYCSCTRVVQPAHDRLE
jgi:deferrochelatase/peroxidase EfeB